MADTVIIHCDHLRVVGQDQSISHGMLFGISAKAIIMDERKA